MIWVGIGLGAVGMSLFVVVWGVIVTERVLKNEIPRRNVEKLERSAHLDVRR